MTRRLDIVVTWPKSRPLESYLAELERAVEQKLEINFRVSGRPGTNPERCYMVHSGFVRGYNLIRTITWRSDRTVRRVGDDIGTEYWPEGWYIVRSPEWHPIEPIAMRGFQGFRYIERPE